MKLLRYLVLLVVVAMVTFVVSYVAATAIEHFGHHDIAPATVDIDVDGVLARSEIARFDEESSQVFDHILLITLDTLRADHVGSYGYPLPTTPFLDRLASEGVRFARAYAPNNLTCPAHTSILTGLYPTSHGVTRNGERLSDEILTLPEILSAAGYVTAAFPSTNRHFSPANITQGFTTVGEPEDSETVFDRYRPAQGTLDTALNWLAKYHDESRVFVWIHLYDAHLPYVDRTEERTLLEGAASIAWDRSVSETLCRGFRDDRERDEYLKYDAEIRYLDAALGSFFDNAGPYGIDDYLIIVVADHGEGLNEHNFWGHAKYIYEEQIHVPLIVRWPGQVRIGVEDAVVESMDIFPTVLVAAGIGAEYLEDRPHPIEGAPLQDLLDGDADRFGYALARRGTFAPMPFQRYLGYKVRRRLAPLGVAESGTEPGDDFALINGSTKYIARTVHEDKIFDLENDPCELNGSIWRDPVVSEHMRSIVATKYGLRAPTRRTT